MAEKGWPPVKIADEDLGLADELVEQLAAKGLRLTRARVLSAAVVIGLEELQKKPERLVSPRAPRSRAATTKPSG